MASDIEDTGEIVFEEGQDGERRMIEPAPPSWSGDTGFGSFPDVVKRMGRFFRLHRKELVSHNGERTYLRLTYRRYD